MQNNIGKNSGWSDADFDALISALDEGSEEAAWEITKRYSGHIFRVVRRSLMTAVRSQVDSQDFVQAVWKSFLTGDVRPDFGNPEQLIGYLAGMARHKVLNECVKRTKTKAFDVRRETPQNESTQVSSREPTPSQVAIANERWERVMMLAGEDCRQIVQMRLSGKSNVEIAEKLGVNERTVRRNLKNLLDRLDEENES